MGQARYVQEGFGRFGQVKAGVAGKVRNGTEWLAEVRRGKERFGEDQSRQGKVWRGWPGMEWSGSAGGVWFVQAWLGAER